MNNQLKGIAIILFGILLAVAGIGMTNFLPGDYPALVALVGVAVGAVGLVMAAGAKKR